MFLNKARIILTATIILTIMLFACNNQQVKQKQPVSRTKLAEGFIAPADSMQTAVYWYWISDNISKEGVVKDLHAMKKAGINRAFIGNIGLNEVPYGNVKMLSEEWWEILHTALHTATELNIEIGIFNSPGWSQSGGPWVKAENAMRYLTASETRVKGPVRFLQKLQKPIELFQDVRVIAYPALNTSQSVLDLSNSKLNSQPAVAGLSKLLDGDVASGIVLPDEKTFIIDIHAENEFTARSLSIQSTSIPLKAKVLFQAKNEKGEYTTIKDFEMDRSNPSLNVGFVPFAPVVLAFSAITSKDFRLLVTPEKPDGWYAGWLKGRNPGISEITISSNPKVERYIEKTLAKMHATPLPYWHNYQWPQQEEVADKSLVVDPYEVIDISKNLLVDGTLNWDVPEGEWIILRTGMTPTGTTNGPASPKATGYEVDKMSKQHAALHFDGHMGEILRRIPEEDRKCLKVVVQDSYETGGQNFTDGFLKDFEDEYGYDPLPYLPVYQGVVVGSQQASDRFLWDMRRLVANKVAYDYVGGLRDISHEHGLTTWLENYGHWGFPGEFLMYGGQSDEIGGEFWSEGELGDIENRAASSCGHIYGKTKIWAESNTCGGMAFSRYPAMIKQRGDRFFAEGINATLLHVYIHQPYEEKNPGVNAGFGNEFNRKNTWFSQIDVYIEYLKRTNYMLQQGLNVADVAYFIGEDAPKMTGVTDPALPVGYQFDYMNAEVIERDMYVKDGLITLPHGTQYRLMVLPLLETMRPELLIKIKQLVNDGAVILGPAPKRSPSLQNQPLADKQVQEIAAELWGGVDGQNVKWRKVGKGMILDGMEMKEALTLINCVPDCNLSKNNNIHYCHRTLANAEIYFLSNQTDKEQIVTPEFRVTGLQPELWKATTGSIRDLPAYERKAEVTAVPLKLAPFESVCVVFSKKAGKTNATGIEANYPKPELISTIKTPWIVSFDPNQRGPEEQVKFDKLIDWTKSDDERIKYYSGTAIYTNTFSIDRIEEQNKLFVDLGDLTAMAKVSINGKYVGGVWTPPYKLEITQFLVKGENELKVEIVNTWVNRIIGDLKLSEKERKTWAPIIPYTADSPLQPAGLFGPVKILASKTI